MGIALFHGHYIDGGFTMPFYKVGFKLLKPYSFSYILDVAKQKHLIE